MVVILLVFFVSLTEVEYSDIVEIMKKRLLRLIQSYKQELFILGLATFLLLLFIPIFTYLYFAQDLKSKDTIMNRNNTGIVLLDRNGKSFFSFYAAHNTDYVPLSQIPKVAQEAVIEAEDRHFYQHPGFSISAIIAAFVANIKHGELAYGGSTITQQLVKNALLTSRKSFLRKYQELVLAAELERRFTKQQILEMYLNSVYFGEGAFGIESAAHTYFGESAKQLTLPQAAMLAGILTAPSEYSPISGDKVKAKERQQYVLNQMRAEGYISKDEEQQALATTLSFSHEAQDLSLLAPHFALLVRDQMIKQYGEEQIARSGFKIYTTLDLNWQKYADQVVAEQVKALRPEGANNGSAVVIDPTNGEVRVMVGSYNWNDPQFGKVNMAITPRQPGSSFKPIVYARALDERIITPATMLMDVKTTFPGNYTPLDYDRKFRGPVLVRRALANSLNIPAVEVMQKVGVADALDEAETLGISTLGNDTSNYGLSLVLGAGSVKLTELTDVYATFANKGWYNPVTTITKIVDKEGKTVYQYKPKPEHVLDTGVAFLISSILSDNQARAEEFGTVLDISRTAAVKTGTTEDFKDALTMGYTPQLAVGVWVGNNYNTPMDTIAGSLGAAPIWKKLMEKFLAGTPVENFQQPESVQKLYVCRSNGYLVKTATSSAMPEYFLDGTGPTRYCTPTAPRPTISSVPMPTASVTITPPPEVLNDKVKDRGHKKKPSE